LRESSRNRTPLFFAALATVRRLSTTASTEKGQDQGQNRAQTATHPQKIENPNENQTLAFDSSPYPFLKESKSRII
jgi:hypothetical protein